ncbi:hypothetical protein HPB47_011024, partial [Ixodes persulcatus]
VLEVSMERWRIDGCLSVSTMTRTAVLRLNGGVTPDDILHQLRVAGELALVVVPGRASLCLRCQRTGLVRKECRVPKCNVFRRFGHDGTQCVRTYAVAAAPVGGNEKSDMDEAGAEEAISGPDAGSAGTARQAELPDVASVEATKPSDEAAAVRNGTISEPADDTPMEVLDASAGDPATKRMRDDVGADPDATSQGEHRPRRRPSGGNGLASSRTLLQTTEGLRNYLPDLACLGPFRASESACRTVRPSEPEPGVGSAS